LWDHWRQGEPIAIILAWFIRPTCALESEFRGKRRMRTHTLLPKMPKDATNEKDVVSSHVPAAMTTTCADV